MSRLQEDMRLYYRNSYVGLKTPGGVVPFFVEEVAHDYNVYDPFRAHARDAGIDPDDFDEDTDEYPVTPDTYHYTEESYNALVFHGNSGGTRIAVKYEDLETELPELGYVKVGDRYQYLSYISLRQAKKGVTPERVVGLGGFNLYGALEYAYGTTKCPLIVMGGQLLLKDDVMYKGVRIGRMNNGNIEIDVAEAAYLIPFIEKSVECQVSLISQ